MDAETPGDGRGQSATIEQRDDADPATAREAVASARDAAALERDAVAALRDAELAAGEAAVENDLRVVAEVAAKKGGRASIRRVAAAHFLAADARARAARDREEAAHDREQAARDRLQAREEREVLLAELACAQEAAKDDDS